MTIFIVQHNSRIVVDAKKKNRQKKKNKKKYLLIYAGYLMKLVSYHFLNILMNQMKGIFQLILVIGI